MCDASIKIFPTTSLKKNQLKTLYVRMFIVVVVVVVGYAMFFIPFNFNYLYNIFRPVCIAIASNKFTCLLLWFSYLFSVFTFFFIFQSHLIKLYMHETTQAHNKF